MTNRRVARQLTVLVAAFLAFALITAACSNKDDKTTTAQSGTTVAGQTDGSTAPTAAKSDFNQAEHDGTPQDGGSITIGVESQTATLDPAGALSQPSDIDMALAIYDHLIDRDDAGKLAPSLATKWTASADLKTWTITLRTGIVFQDGTPFNADAVVKQFERFKDPATNCACKSQVEPLTKVEAPNETTVVFTLAKANAFWSSTLAGTLGFIASPTATAKWGADYPRHPVGTGPFSLPNYDDQVLQRNPKYWKKDADGVQLPYLSSIKVTPIPDARIRLTSLQSGDVDMIQTADTGTIVDIVKQKSAAFKVQKVTGTSSTIVLFNMKKAPFDDVRIRQAFAYGMNRAEINNVQYQGSRQESYGPFPPDSPFYTKTDAPHYDPAKAKALVAAAKADGKPTSFTAVCIPTDESRRVLGLVKQQMTAIGLTMTNEFLDQGALVNKVLTKTGDYQASCFRNGQISDADGLYNALYTDGSSNAPFYSNASVDKALDDIRATTDAARQIKDLGIVQKQVAKDIPTIPILFDLFGNIYSSKLSGLPVPEQWSLGAIKFTTLYLKK